MNTKRTTLFLAVLLIALGKREAAAITIATVPVGNPGNAPDTSYYTTGFGSVDHVYRIGKYEVTVGQYTAFLNAVGATDTYCALQPDMATHPNGGISQSGVSGSYSYSVIGSANKPVTYVNWGDAARFTNWLHNGQPTGAQERKHHRKWRLSQWSQSNAALNAITRNAGARWFIPSENEWYKAAYHETGGRGNYWSYPPAPTTSQFGPAAGRAGIQSNVATSTATTGSPTATTMATRSRGPRLTVQPEPPDRRGSVH